MLVSIEHKYVFLCNPKCATCSSESMLEPYSDILYLHKSAIRHTNYRHYEKYIKPYLEDVVDITNSLETICLVREPVSWLYSWYRFRSRYELRKSAELKQYSTTGISFSEFVEAYMISSPPPFANIGNQIDFVKNESGQVGVDTIFAYEKNDLFVSYLSDIIGKKLSLGRENVSPASARDSNIYAYIGVVMRKVNNRLNFPHAVFAVNERESKLPVHLSRSLRKFIPDDFMLHEMATNGKFFTKCNKNR